MTKEMWMRVILGGAIFIVGTSVLIPRLRESRWFASGSADDVEVLVANHYIPSLTGIRNDLVQVRLIPKAYVPPGALHALTELKNESGQLLFTASVPIPEGQPITRTLVTDVQESDTLAGLIRAGRVAVSFEVDRAHGVGGWIKPGDTISVFRTGGLRAPGEKRMTSLLLSSVPVVAVDARRLGQSKEPASATDEEATKVEEATSRVLTILASPKDAALLIEARELGGLSVVLRAPGDDLPWPPTL